MRRVALLAFGFALATSSCSSPSSANAFKPCTPHGFTTPGEKIPDCTFEGFNGSPTLRLTQLKGKPAVLNFWASWCINCIEEMPAFQRVFASLQGRVTFVGMDVLGLQGETKGAGRAFAKRTGVHYRLAYDPGGLLYAHFSPTIQRPIMPISVFIDAHGVVKERHFGPFTAAELRNAIKKFLSIT
jgi:cytochrome c biogenesis protein CcmG/thiol:disulfide interchange protein DsbE